MNLLRIAELTGDVEVRKKAEETLRLFKEGMESEPSAHTNMLAALGFLLGSPREIVVVGGRGGTTSMVREIHRGFLPNKVLLLLRNESGGLEKVSPLVQGKRSLGGKPTVYVCQNYTCKKPITDIEELKAELSS